MNSLKSILRYLKFCSGSEERESSSDVFIAEFEHDNNEDSGDEEQKHSGRKNDLEWLDGDNEKGDEKDDAYEIEKINKDKCKNFINVRWVKNTDKEGFEYVVLQAAQCTANGMELKKRKFEFKDEYAVWGFLKLEPHIDKLNLQHLLLRGVTDFAIKFFAEYYMKARERETGGKEVKKIPKYMEEQRMFNYLLDKDKFRDFKCLFEKEVKKYIKITVWWTQMGFCTI